MEQTLFRESNSVQQSKNYLHLVEPKGSLPNSLVSASGPFTESNESSPHGFR